MKQDYRMTYLVIILILLIISAASITLGLIVPAINAEPTVLYNLPQIISPISDSDGNPHILTSQFSLELDRDVTVSQTKLFNDLYELMKEIEYDKLVAEGGTEYIRGEVRDYVIRAYGEDVEVSVYIYDLAIDIYIEPPKKGGLGNAFENGFR